jgi:hypothetical protein
LCYAGGADDDDDDSSDDGSSDDGSSDGSDDSDGSDGSDGSDADGSGSGTVDADGMDGNGSSHEEMDTEGGGEPVPSDDDDDGDEDDDGRVASPAPSSLMERLLELRRVVIDTINAVRTVATHLMVYRLKGLDDAASTVIARCLYDKLPSADRATIITHLVAKVRAASATSCDIKVVVCDDESENQTGVRTTEHSSAAHLKEAACAEAARCVKELQARAKQASDDAARVSWTWRQHLAGGVPSAADATRRDKTAVKALLVEEILKHMVLDPLPRAPEASGSRVLEGVEGMSEGFRTDVEALVKELQRQAQAHTPNGSKTKFESACDGALSALGALVDGNVRVREVLELALPSASRQAFGFRRQVQLLTAVELQRSVEDSRVTVAMLQQQLAQAMLDLERRRRAADNPAMPRDSGMHLAVGGFLTAVCQVHKLKCTVSGFEAADGESGSVMSKADLVEAAGAVHDEGSDFMAHFLCGKGDKQNVMMPTAILYSTSLQKALRSRGHIHSATLMDLLARCFQAWDVSGLDAHVRAWSNELMRRVLMVMVGPGVHTAGVNHTTRAGRVGGMTLPLVCTLIKNIEALQQLQADYPAWIKYLKERGLTQDDVERYFSCLMSWFTGHATARTLQPALAKSDRLQWLSDMSDEERGFRMPVGRSTKTYASAEGGRGSEAWNDGRRSAGPGFAPTDEMARLCATVMKKAAAAFGGAGGSSIRTLHHRKNK